MAIENLNECDGECTSCVKKYIEKHRLRKGVKEDKFGIACGGILKQQIPDSIMAALGENAKTAVAMKDPVVWAAEMLDWHCIDPDGAVWKRKTQEGTLGKIERYDPNNPEHVKRAKEGKSPYHRPYQKAMLSCTSKRKVFRCGRQIGKTYTICVAMLHAVFTHEDFAVQVIAPYQTQVKLIFKNLEELIKNSGKLASSVVRNVKAPNYEIVLANGSSVAGYTAGSHSKQEAGSVRGQSGQMLCLDEADYLSPADIDSVLAVITNFPDATVWMSSTPTGRREKFYQSCNSRQYKEFYFPSQVNPNWSEELDTYFRNELTAGGYEHEIEANWGEQEEGVYQNKFIEVAQADYEYGTYKPNPKWIYAIGVDWNDMKIGTTISVVGHNPFDGLFYLVDKEIVSRAERTQLAACQKIAELNRLWNPAFIYTDFGFGSTQREVLHDFGMRQLEQFGANHPDARLRFVKSYDFGSSIEITDPFTKQLVPKPAKPFLVENSVRRFEGNVIRYPRSDKQYTQQLQNYIIDHVSITGRPVYAARDEIVGDHYLDAVNLALVAFALEKGAFSRPVYSTEVGFAGRLGAGENSGKENSLSNSFAQEAEQHKPKSGRASVVLPDTRIIKPVNGELPASNTSVASEVKIWAWPGFGHDAPKPQARPLGEAMRQAAGRVLGNRGHGGNRPQRKKW